MPLTNYSNLFEKREFHFSASIPKTIIKIPNFDKKRKAKTTHFDKKKITTK